MSNEDFFLTLAQTYGDFAEYAFGQFGEPFGIKFDIPIPDIQ